MNANLTKLKSLLPEEVFPHLLEEFFKIPASNVEVVCANSFAIFSILDQELRKITLPFSCRKGCTHCCHLNVDSFLHERLAMLSFILLFNDERWNILNKQLHKWGKNFSLFLEENRFSSSKFDRFKFDFLIQKYESKSFSCPFLHENVCLIYEVRPIACRTYFSWSPPEDCMIGMKKEIKQPSYAAEWKLKMISTLGRYDEHFFGKAEIEPLGLYFFKRASEINEIRNGIKEYSKSVPMNQPPVDLKVLLNNDPVSIEKAYLVWPVYQFIEKCFERVEAMRKEAH